MKALLPLLYVQTSMHKHLNWPPQWKKEGKDGPAKTFKEKMMEKAQAAAEIVAKKAAEAAEAGGKRSR